MLFDSIEFAFFLPIVFALYWLCSLSGARAQNLLIVVASYIFYGWWDATLLVLIVISTIVDFVTGLLLGTEENRLRRRLLLGISLAVNLSLLGFFKYYNFFVDNFTTAFTFLGYHIQDHTLEIVLPIGISFYTFQTLSYTIDVYKGKLTPTRDILAFTSFVAFFPQLVAGPIEKARDLLPQFYQSRKKLNYAQAVDGLRQTLWGLFKKVVIADNCAPHVNYIFENSEQLDGSTLLLGVTLFSFQLYGDFSGYSDIAIGTSRLFGIRLTRNFVFPFFSRDVAEYWRRWHISISKWFRDYVYIPLGGSQGGKWMMIRNTFLVFVISGFWHGANWTFILWATLNAIIFIPLMILGTNRKHLEIVAKGKVFPSLYEIGQMIVTFLIRQPSIVFFRATSFSHGVGYLTGMFSTSLFSNPSFEGKMGAVRALVLIGVMLVIEWFGREGEHALSRMNYGMPKPARWIFYALVIFMIGMFMSTQEIQFIYFQF